MKLGLFKVDSKLEDPTTEASSNPGNVLLCYNGAEHKEYY